MKNEPYYLSMKCNRPTTFKSVLTHKYHVKFRIFVQTEGMVHFSLDITGVFEKFSNLMFGSIIKCCHDAKFCGFVKKYF